MGTQLSTETKEIVKHNNSDKRKDTNHNSVAQLNI